jgi:hypothetical protein
MLDGECAILRTFAREFAASSTAPRCKPTWQAADMLSCGEQLVAVRSQLVYHQYATRGYREASQHQGTCEEARKHTRSVRSE